MLVLGAAGVGKSYVIKTIYHLLTRLFEKEEHGTNISGLPKIILAAPAGKAAHLINGNTLDYIFKLPLIERNDRNQPSTLTPSVTNTIYANLKDVELCIIDEISMMGSKKFNFIDVRMQQLYGLTNTDTHFGNKSMILFGDFYQLLPVLGTPIYKTPNIKGVSIATHFKLH